MLGLHALQHRGQEAAGIVTYDNGQFIAERHLGLVGDVFGRKSDAAQQSEGPLCASAMCAIPRPAAPAPRNIQPMFADLTGGGIAHRP